MKGSCAGLVAFGLVACSVVGTWRAVADLPGIGAPPPSLDEDHASVTWLGQGVGTAYGLGFLLLLLIYVGKRWITRWASNRPNQVVWYCLAVAGSLPYIWFLVVLDWQNPFVYRVSCWVYDPITIWFVPTVSFAWDVTRRTPCTGQAYWLRSVGEIAVAIPVWLVVWTFVSFFLLGGGWI